MVLEEELRTLRQAPLQREGRVERARALDARLVAAQVHHLRWRGRERRG